MILVMVILVSQVMDYMKIYNDDMVLANYKLLTEHLNVNHLRLMGTSMGGMQSWVWIYLP
jgi:homoserine O-acetyltransferase